MALNKTFIYTKHLIFADTALEITIRNTLLKKAIPEKALHYGQIYDKELSLGMEAPSSIEWVHQDVGFGLYSSVDLLEGSFIGEYTGLISENSCYYKMKNYVFTYPLEDSLGRNFSIDAEPTGNRTRFINHSFNHNLTPVHAFHRGLYHVILIANKSIKKGEQFTYSYGASYWYLRGSPILLNLGTHD